MGNARSREGSLSSAVLENFRSGKRRIDRLLGQPARNIAVGPRGDSLLMTGALQGVERLGVFFVMNGSVKHIDDITYEKGGRLFLKDSFRIVGCVLHRRSAGARSSLLVKMDLKQLLPVGELPPHDC